MVRGGLLMGIWFLFQGYENVLKLIVVIVAHICECTKTTEMHTLYRQIE